MTNVSLPDKTLCMIASWLSLKASKPKCSCKWAKRESDEATEGSDGLPDATKGESDDFVSFSTVLLLAVLLVFLIAVFFVTVVAMLFIFLPHLLSDQGNPREFSRAELERPRV